MTKPQLVKVEALFYVFTTGLKMGLRLFRHSPITKNPLPRNSVHLCIGNFIQLNLLFYYKKSAQFTYM